MNNVYPVHCCIFIGFNFPSVLKKTKVGRGLFRISEGTPTTLKEDFHGMPQSFQANIRRVT
jgi:hypothetical protein